MKKRHYILAFTFLILFVGLSKGQVRYTNIHYTIGVPTGETKDFISETSFRGFGIEFGKYVKEDISASILVGWNTFYEALPKATYPIDNGEVRGQQYRYLNSMPILVNGQWHLDVSEKIKLSSHLGMGVGTYYNKQRTDMGIYSVSSSSWQFGFAPQAGFSIPVSGATLLNLGVVYNYALKTSNIGAQQWLAVNIGFGFDY